MAKMALWYNVLDMANSRELSRTAGEGSRRQALADLVAPSLRAVLEGTGWRIAGVGRQAPAGASRLPLLIVRLESGQVSAVLAVEASANPRPADVEVLRQAAQSGAAPGEGAAFVLFAPRVPSALAARLRELGLGYLDLSGACRLRAPGLYIERLPRESGVLSPAAHPGVEDLLGQSAAGLPAESVLGVRPLKRHRVLRAMLCYPDRKWHQSELAAETGTDVSSHVHQVVKFLEREHYADHEGRGPHKVVFLARPGDLLDDWSRYWRDLWGTAWRRAGRYLSLEPDADANQQALAQAARDLGGRLAFTLTTGSDYYGSFLRDDVVCAYYQGNASELVRQCDLEPVDRGENTIILSVRDEGVFYLPEGTARRLGQRASRAAAPVCPVQLYLDMRAAGGRYAEQAGALRQAEIGY